MHSSSAEEFQTRQARRACIIGGVIRAVFFDFDGTLYDRDLALRRLAREQHAMFKDEIDEVLEPIDDIRRDMAESAAAKGAMADGAE